MDDNIYLLTLSKKNRNDFLDKLTSALHERFGDNIPENYGDSHNWSLLKLIKRNRIDTYQLLYINDKIWTGTGGIIRRLNSKKVYQAAFRGFSCAGLTNKGLGIKTPTFIYCLDHQIERAKFNKCDSIILSFNEENKRLFEVTKNYTLPKTFKPGEWKASEKPILFNDTKQWMLTMKL
jgi:hypothetical protein